MYQEALSRQLALDYCCSPADVADSKIILQFMYRRRDAAVFRNKRFAG